MVPLRLLSEQVAIPLDQVARFLDDSSQEAMRLLIGLDSAGCIEKRRFLVGEAPWFWPSHRGARLSGTDFSYLRPNLVLLQHRRAVNEVRIHLRSRAQQGRWLCERSIYRQRDPEDHLPDAIFEIGAERHAIEVELSRKNSRKIRQIVTQHSNRYDAVVYFCGNETYKLMMRVQAEGCWPKLVVRHLPGSQHDV